MAAALIQSLAAAANGVIRTLLPFAVVKVVVMWAFEVNKQQQLKSAGTPNLHRTLASLLVALVVLATTTAALLKNWSIGPRLIIVDFMAACTGLMGLRPGY